jgi:hypothetical protein
MDNANTSKANDIRNVNINKSNENAFDDNKAPIDYSEMNSQEFLIKTLLRVHCFFDCLIILTSIVSCFEIYSYLSVYTSDFVIFLLLLLYCILSLGLSLYAQLNFIGTHVNFLKKILVGFVCNLLALGGVFGYIYYKFYESTRKIDSMHKYKDFESSQRVYFGNCFSTLTFGIFFILAAIFQVFKIFLLIVAIRRRKAQALV